MAVGYWNHTAVAEFAFLTCIFIISWSFLGYRRLRYLLVAAGLLQAFLVFGQLVGVFPSRHLLFSVTGFMGNPGQMGGFQAVSLSCCLSLLRECKGRKFRKWTVAAVLLLSVSLAVSDSRAGMVAAVAGAVFVYRDKLQGLFKRRKYLVPVCIGTVAAVAAGLYFYRSGSVDARLLVWRVSLDMIADKPLTGFGPGNFPYHYMLYQADYFMTRPESSFAAVADNVLYPFNEYIKLAVELGLLGLILFIAALCIIWRRSKSREGFAPLVALLVFGFFSYPSDKLLLASLLPLAAGAVLNDNTAHNRIRIRLIAASVAAVAAIWIYAGSGIVHPAEKYAGTPNCETWCDLGEACENDGDYVQAENYYRTASYMVPTRLRPNYLLWKLYIGSGRETEAREMARKILSMPLKVENTFTLRVRDEVRKAAERGVLHQGHR